MSGLMWPPVLFVCVDRCISKSKVFFFRREDDSSDNWSFFTYRYLPFRPEAPEQASLASNSKIFNGEVCCFRI